VRALKEASENYANITWIKVDWDLYRDDDWVKDMRVQYQSTIVAFKDGEQVGRLVGQTSEGAISALLDKTL
jgi:thioredoxin-like negative regulator of GroEL